MARLSPISPRSLFIELFIIVVVALFASRAFLDGDPSLPLPGREAQFLTASAYIANQSIQTTGRLALWNPWIVRGEPTIDDAYSFLLNPLSTLPSLLYGPRVGIKYSIAIYAVFVGIGGWLLGRMLNLSAPGRVVLALLLIGRGGLNSFANAGYPQFGTAQTYFPWVVAATLGIIRFARRRAPVVLLALILTLQFWAGIIYYTLPSVLMVVALAAAFALIKDKHTLPRIDMRLVVRVVAALMLTIILAAATLLPIFSTRSYIGGHDNESQYRVYERPSVVIGQLFTTEQHSFQDTWNETYYIYTAPLWFAALLFLVLPPITPALHHPSEPRTQRRIAIVALVMIAWFFTWGTGTNPIVKWMYDNLPLIAQWRGLSRLLAVCSFWVVVLIAMRFDGLWRAVVLSRRWNGWFERRLRIPEGQAHKFLRVGLLAVCLVLAIQTDDSWEPFGSGETVDPFLTNCMRWLRDRYPDQPVAVWTRDYITLTPYIEYQVRFSHFTGDYHLMGMPSRLYNGDLREAPVEYVQAFEPEVRRRFLDEGYSVVENSPHSPYVPYLPCLLQRQDVLSYAFTIPVATLQTIADDAIPDPAMTIPITALRQQYDHVALIVNGDRFTERVLVVQELAFPGWRVMIDDAPAILEPVGQMVGVILPRDDEPHQILFIYDPPLLRLGGLITVIAALACILYLLEIDRRLLYRAQPRRALAPVSPPPVPRPAVALLVAQDTPPLPPADTPQPVTTGSRQSSFPVRPLVLIVVAVPLLVLLARQLIAALGRRTRR